ncbi:MAG TPA: hypothetical protein VIM73_02465, partial [Polyangiaceae bacterium]
MKNRHAPEDPAAAYRALTFDKSALEPNPDGNTRTRELSVVASARRLEELARRSIESRRDSVRFVHGNDVVRC